METLIISVEVPSSQKTLAYVKLTKAYQHTYSPTLHIVSLCPTFFA